MTSHLFTTYSSSRDSSRLSLSSQRVSRSPLSLHIQTRPEIPLTPRISAVQTDTSRSLGGATNLQERRCDSKGSSVVHCLQKEEDLQKKISYQPNRRRLLVPPLPRDPASRLTLRRLFPLRRPSVPSPPPTWARQSQVTKKKRRESCKGNAKREPCLPEVQVS